MRDKDGNIIDDENDNDVDENGFSSKNVLSLLNAKNVKKRKEALLSVEEVEYQKKKRAWKDWLDKIQHRADLEALDEMEKRSHKAQHQPMLRDNKAALGQFIEIDFQRRRNERKEQEIGDRIREEFVKAHRERLAKKREFVEKQVQHGRFNLDEFFVKQQQVMTGVDLQEDEKYNERLRQQGQENITPQQQKEPLDPSQFLSGSLTALMDNYKDVVLKQRYHHAKTPLGETKRPRKHKSNMQLNSSDDDHNSDSFYDNTEDFEQRQKEKRDNTHVTFHDYFEHLRNDPGYWIPSPRHLRRVAGVLSEFDEESSERDGSSGGGEANQDDNVVPQQGDDQDKQNNNVTAAEDGDDDDMSDDSNKRRKKRSPKRRYVGAETETNTDDERLANYQRQREQHIIEDNMELEPLFSIDSEDDDDEDGDDAEKKNKYIDFDFGDDNNKNNKIKRLSKKRLQNAWVKKDFKSLLAAAYPGLEQVDLETHALTEHERLQIAKTFRTLQTLGAAKVSAVGDLILPQSDPMMEQEFRQYRDQYGQKQLLDRKEREVLLQKFQVDHYRRLYYENVVEQRQQQHEHLRQVRHEYKQKLRLQETPEQRQRRHDRGLDMTTDDPLFDEINENYEQQRNFVYNTNDDKWAKTKSQRDQDKIRDLGGSNTTRGMRRLFEKAGYPADIIAYPDGPLPEGLDPKHIDGFDFKPHDVPDRGSELERFDEVYVPSDNAQFTDEDFAHHYYKKDMVDYALSKGLDRHPFPDLDSPLKEQTKKEIAESAKRAQFQNVGNNPGLDSEYEPPAQFMHAIPDTITVAERAQKIFAEKYKAAKDGEKQKEDERIVNLLKTKYENLAAQPDVCQLVINPLNPTMQQLQRQYKDHLLTGFVAKGDIPQNGHLLDQLGLTATGKDPVFQQYIMRVIDRFGLKREQLKDMGILSYQEYPTRDGSDPITNPKRLAEKAEREKRNKEYQEDGALDPEYQRHEKIKKERDLVMREQFAERQKAKQKEIAEANKILDAFKKRETPRKIKKTLRDHAEVRLQRNLYRGLRDAPEYEHLDALDELQLQRDVWRSVEEPLPQHMTWKLRNKPWHTKEDMLSMTNWQPMSPEMEKAVRETKPMKNIPQDRWERDEHGVLQRIPPTEDTSDYQTDGRWDYMEGQKHLEAINEEKRRKFREKYPELQTSEPPSDWDHGPSEWDLLRPSDMTEYDENGVEKEKKEKPELMEFTPEQLEQIERREAEVDEEQLRFKKLWTTWQNGEFPDVDEKLKAKLAKKRKKQEDDVLDAEALKDEKPAALRRDETDEDGDKGLKMPTKGQQPKDPKGPKGPQQTDDAESAAKKRQNELKRKREYARRMEQLELETQLRNPLSYQNKATQPEEYDQAKARQDVEFLKYVRREQMLNPKDPEEKKKSPIFQDENETPAAQYVRQVAREEYEKRLADYEAVEERRRKAPPPDPTGGPMDMMSSNEKFTMRATRKPIHPDQVRAFEDKLRKAVIEKENARREEYRNAVAEERRYYMQREQQQREQRERRRERKEQQKKEEEERQKNDPNGQNKRPQNNTKKESSEEPEDNTNWREKYESLRLDDADLDTHMGFWGPRATQAQIEKERIEMLVKPTDEYMAWHEAMAEKLLKQAGPSPEEKRAAMEAAQRKQRSEQRRRRREMQEQGGEDGGEGMEGVTQEQYEQFLQYQQMMQQQQQQQGGQQQGGQQQQGYGSQHMESPEDWQGAGGRRF